MRSISSLVAKLASNHPEITFLEGKIAHWSADEIAVYYNSSETHADWVLLHETAHGLLGHSGYQRDIDLIKMERDAWLYAAHTLAPRYNTVIDPSFIEAQLDTYRDWLHSKSTCPTCQSNGYETTKHSYVCVHCGSTWHANIGIDTEIRRFITK